jgi:hypothetical protein
LYSGIASDPTVPNATSTHIATTALEALATDQEALTSKVESLLLGVPLPSLAHSIVAKAVFLVPATNKAERVRMALYLTASSYFFQVQH